MGSGFSACSGPNSVGISADPSRDATKVKSTQAQVHSDSCDSGISVCEGAKQLKKGRQHVRANPGIHDVESEEEMVAGSDVGCGTDFLMTSTPRQDVKKAESDSDGSVQLIDTRKGRPQSRTSSKTSLRNNPHSAPNLLDHAIHEEDEEEYDGEPEDKRLRAQRPPRPKSAHFRKSRAQARARSAKSRSSHARNGSVSGGESSADLSSEEDGFDSDVLSIPDETTSHSARPNTLTTIRLGPQFQAPTSPPINTPTHNDNHHLNHHHHDDDDMDWWNDDVDSARQTGGHVSRTYSDYSASGSFTWRGGVLVREGRVAKKASERSISSILLTTAVELDSSGSALNTTNPACFAVTNPEITQHILKVSATQLSRQSSISSLTRRGSKLSETPVTKLTRRGSKLSETPVTKLTRSGSFKKVSFSPDVPIFSKSDGYHPRKRLFRKVGILPQVRLIAWAENKIPEEEVVAVEETKKNFVCKVCKSDCIKRVLLTC